VAGTSDIPTGDADTSQGLSTTGLTEAQLALPNAARMYDYYLGGHHNMAIDREAADRAISIYPGFSLVMRVNRAFLRRAVKYVVDQGVERLLDIGSGIPTVGSVHQVAQAANPHAQAVYVDVDSVVLAHSTAMLRGNPRAQIVRGDLRAPQSILNQPAVRDLLEPGKPVALILAFVLHFVVDDQQALGVVRTLRDALPSGSYVVLSHGTMEHLPPVILDQLVRLYSTTSQPVRIRTRQEIEAFFENLELVPPGVVFVPLWRPEDPADLLQDRQEESSGFAGVGRKTW